MNDSNLPAPVPTTPTLDDFLAGLRALGYAVNAAWQDFINFLQPTARNFVRILSRLAEADVLPPPRHKCRRDRPVIHAHVRPRNTRIQAVQAKRKRLNLDQYGLYPALRSRKASYAYAQAVERWCEDKQENPRLRDFERMPARRLRRLRKRVLKRGWQWMDGGHVNCKCCWMSDQEDATRYAISALVSDLSTPVENQPGEVHHE